MGYNSQFVEIWEGRPFVHVWQGRVQRDRRVNSGKNKQSDNSPGGGAFSPHVRMVPCILHLWVMLLYLAMTLGLVANGRSAATLLMEIPAGLLYLCIPIVFFYFTAKLAFEEIPSKQVKRSRNSLYCHPMNCICPLCTMNLRCAQSSKHSRGGVKYTAFLFPPRQQTPDQRDALMVIENWNSLEVNRLLLVLAGDVEVNPGPITLHDLTNELEKLTKPITFGNSLKIPLEVLGSIEQNYKLNVDGRKKALFEYIASNYEKHEITWAKIADALEVVARDLAVEIRQKYCGGETKSVQVEGVYHSKKTTAEVRASLEVGGDAACGTDIHFLAESEDTVLSVAAHLKPLKLAIWEARAKWPVIGRALSGISEGTMLAIHDKDDGECLNEVLSEWIHTGKATIRDLLRALADKTVKRNDITNEIHVLKGASEESRETGFSSEENSAKVVTMIEHFERRFHDLRVTAASEVAVKGITIQAFRRTLTALPLNITNEHKKFFRENYSLFEEAKSIESIFSHLNFYLSFIDFSLLEHIVEHFGSDRLQRDMKSYSKDMRTFRMETMVNDVIPHLPLRSDSPQHYSKLSLKVNFDTATNSLEDVDQYRKRFASEFLLSEFMFFLKEVKEGSLLLVGLIPRALVSLLTHRIQNCDPGLFSQKLHIHEVCVSGKIIYPDQSSSLSSDSVSVHERKPSSGFANLSSDKDPDSLSIHRAFSKLLHLSKGTATTTADHIGTAIGIDPKQLDQPCSEDLLLTIARLLPNWMEYADPLKMTPQEINGIYTDLDLTYAMKSYTLLRTWYRKNAYMGRCHYRVLVEASCDLGYADVAGEICKLIKGHPSPVTEDSSVEHISKDLILFKEKPIGGGAYGVVLKGEINGQPCAIKVLHLLASELKTGLPIAKQTKQDTLDRFRQECEYLETFKHPNVVRHLATITHPKTGLPVLALELMDCNLRQFFSSPSGKDLPFLTQKSLCRDIASALAYIHSRHIVHRDLCSDNILLDCKGETPVAKVCDFGMSRIIKSEGTSISLPAFGHRGYLPPEATDVDSSRFDFSYDIFAFGAIMVQIVRCLPTIKSRKERTKELDQIDSAHPLKPIIEQCLQMNRDDRPSAIQLERKLT